MPATDELRLAEYRQISEAIMDIDRRLVQVFAGTVASAGVLVAAAIGKRGGTPLGAAVLSVAPSFLVLAALNFQVSLRREIAKLGMYRKVFFADGTWERALTVLRDVDRTPEANDPMSAVYWCFVGLSVALVFIRGSFWGLLLSAVAAYLLWQVDQQWKRVYDRNAGDAARFERLWEQAKNSIETPSR
jgi:hypothetical protein